MPVTVKIEWYNPNPNSIWNKLAAKIGRTPTNQEAAEEVRRILREASDARLVEQADNGTLPWQRKR